MDPVEIGAVSLSSLGIVQELITALVAKGVLTKQDVVSLLSKAEDKQNSLDEISSTTANLEAAQIIKEIASCFND